MEKADETDVDLEKIEERTSININDELKKKMDEFKLTNNSTHQLEYKRSPI
jgi:FKBP-type peptidyl-prolyl cis-trans isomerase (trigger factor)